MFSPISCNDFARFCKQALISIFNEGTGIGCSRQNWTTHGHSPPAIKVLLAPDHYCKRKWRWTLLWVIILFDVAQIQDIQRETHFQLGLYAGRVWLTKFGYPSAAAGGVKIDFMIFLVAEWGTGPLRVTSNLRIHVNDIKHFEMHKIALGQYHQSWYWQSKVMYMNFCSWSISRMDK